MRDFPFPGSKIVFFGNPEDIHNLFAEIFGEEETFPVGKNPSESSADFPNGMIRDEDCSACKAKDCPIRKAPYGSTQPAPSVMEALRAEKAKADLRLREADLARHYMLGKDAETPKPRSPYLWPSVSVEDFVKGVENLKLHLDKGIGKTTVPKPPTGSVNFNLGKPFDSLREKMESEIKKLDKKRKDAELDALSERLYARLSKHFYRERGARLSRIDELLTQVADLTEENRKLKVDLAGKEEAMGYYKRAVANPDSVVWNNKRRSPAAAFIYVTAEEFETLKALKAGTASVTVNPPHQPPVPDEIPLNHLV